MYASGGTHLLILLILLLIVGAFLVGVIALGVRLGMRKQQPPMTYPPQYPQQSGDGQQPNDQTPPPSH